MVKQIITLSVAFLTTAISLHAKNENQQAEKENHSLAYGDNILRLYPLKGMDIGAGPAISYERMISADKKISIILPLSLMLENDDIDYNYDNVHYLTYVYFTPGLKFYPTGQRRITYAIGPNLMIGYGGGSESEYYNGPSPSPGYPQYHNVDKRIFRLGVLLNNYVNFQITPSFSIGLSAGLGVRYIDREKQIHPSGDVVINYPMVITGQGSFCVGYRF